MGSVRRASIIVLTGIVSYFTYVLFTGIVAGYMSPVYTWLPEVMDAGWRDAAIRISLMLDWLMVVGPVCLGFGLAYGYSFPGSAQYSGLLIGALFVLSDWVHFYTMLEVWPVSSAVILHSQMVEGLVVMAGFWVSVYCGAKVREARFSDVQV
ncbi:MAG: hypothetical protein MI745_02490 [Pseudomonadales bacterium]|nr:hypothetical protein [Pseudomonadales bacterium]